MQIPELAESEFLFGRCPSCKKEVLVYWDLDDPLSEVLRCVKCDRKVERDLRNADGSELGEQGYEIEGDSKAAGGCGCGSKGGGTCGRPDA